MSSPAPSPALFFDTMGAYQRTEALRAAVALDLFSKIARGAKSPEQLGTACEASARGVRILCDYLTILGFLQKTGTSYDLTEDSKVFLVRESPAYLGGTIDFLLTPHIRDSFQLLTDAVKRGGTAMSDEGTVSHDNPVWVDFARAMAPMMHLPAKLLTNLVASEVGKDSGSTDRPLRVLDIAAGHGFYGIAVAERFKNAHVTALDWANVLAVAQENAGRAGLTGRYTLMPGSAFEVPWGGPYDVVLLTNFLHHFDIPTCEQLAKLAFNALAPGGRAFTLEFIPSPDRISPPPTAVFALTMLATTAKGDAYTFAEYDGIFKAAGFARSEFHALPPTMQQAVVSYKN